MRADLDSRRNGRDLRRDGPRRRGGRPPRGRGDRRRRGGLERATQGIARVIDARGCAVIPGFVQAHVHLCQALFRGMADDLPLLEWLRSRIWPLEAAHDAASLTASAELGLARDDARRDDDDPRHGDGARARRGHGRVRPERDPRHQRQGDDGRGGRRPQRAPRVDAREPRRERAARAGVDEARRGRAHRLRLRAAVHPVVQRGARAWRGGARGGGRVARAHARRGAPGGARSGAERPRGRRRGGAARAGAWRGRARSSRTACSSRDDEARVIARGRDAHRALPEREPEARLGHRARWRSSTRSACELALGADGAPCNNNLDPWTELRHAALLAKVRTGRHLAPRAARAPARDNRRRTRALARRRDRLARGGQARATSWSSGSTARTSSRGATSSRGSSTPAARATWSTCSSTARPSFATERAPGSTTAR